MIRKGVALVLTPTEDHLAAENRNLYRVVNWRDWQNDRRYVAAAARWARAEMPAVTDTRSGKMEIRGISKNKPKLVLHKAVAM